MEHLGLGLLGVHGDREHRGESTTFGSPNNLGVRPLFCTPPSCVASGRLNSFSEQIPHLSLRMGGCPAGLPWEFNEIAMTTTHN